MGSEPSEQGGSAGSTLEGVRIVRSAVAGHSPAGERERASKRRILEALDELEHPFDEHAGPVHVTGSAVVAGPRGTVLHVHRRLGRWMQPGGHLDPGESPAQAALREASEETGLALRHPGEGPRLIHVDVHPAANGHTHLDLRYLLLAGDEDPSPAPGESPEVRWWSWEQATELCDEALFGALEVARLQPEVLEMQQGSGRPDERGGPSTGAPDGNGEPGVPMRHNGG